MLPLDVAQRNSTVAGLPMEFLWFDFAALSIVMVLFLFFDRLFVYILMALLGVILIPFAIFYYEAEDEKGFVFLFFSSPSFPLLYSPSSCCRSSQLGAAFKGVAIIFFIFAILVVVGYIFLGISSVCPLMNTSCQCWFSLFIYRFRSNR